MMNFIIISNVGVYYNARLLREKTMRPLPAVRRAWVWSSVLQVVVDLVEGSAEQADRGDGGEGGDGGLLHENLLSNRGRVLFKQVFSLRSVKFKRSFQSCAHNQGSDGQSKHSSASLSKNVFMLRRTLTND